MSAGKIDLGTIVQISSVTRHRAPWTEDGVVIEVVPPQTLPKLARRFGSADCLRRYVIQTKAHRVIRRRDQMEIIAL